MLFLEENDMIRFAQSIFSAGVLGNFFCHHCSTDVINLFVLRTAHFFATGRNRPSTVPFFATGRNRPIFPCQFTTGPFFNRRSCAVPCTEIFRAGSP
jgi:hypothetical protein